MTAFLLPNAGGGGQEPDRVQHSRLVLIYNDRFLYRNSFDVLQGDILASMTQLQFL